MDPLAQLNDIYLPASVHNYPIAYGWWIVLTVLIVTIIIVTRLILRRKKYTHAKRVAIQCLSQPAQSNDEIITTLKWAALQYFPRKAIAQHHGTQLIDFLVNTLPEKHQASFQQLAQQGFSHRYQVSECAVDNNLQQAALLWLTYALPAKQYQDNSGDNL